MQSEIQESDQDKVVLHDFLTDPFEGTPKQEGLWLNVPYAVYDTWEALRYWYAKTLLQKSPMHLAQKLKDKDKPKESKSGRNWMLEGSIVDAMVLDQQDLMSYSVLPDQYVSISTTGRGKDKKEVKVAKPWNSNAKECRAILNAIKEKGMLPVKKLVWDNCKAIADSLKQNPPIGTMINSSYHQVSMFWIDETYGIPCKGRLDMLTNDYSTIADLKCTTNVHPETFKLRVEKLLYHVQRAMYLSGFEKITGLKPDWIWACVEFDAPWALAQYKAGPETRYAGEVLFAMFLKQYATIQNIPLELWPGYADHVEYIELRKWALNVEEDEEEEKGFWK